MEEFKGKLERGEEIDGKTLLSEALLKELEVGPNSAARVLTAFAAKGVETWGNLLDVDTKEKMIEYAGNEVSGTTIWNKLEEYRNRRPLTLQLLGLDESSNKALDALKQSGVVTWGKLLAVESKEEMIEYAGGDKISGTTIWNAIEAYKQKRGGSGAGKVGATGKVESPLETFPALTEFLRAIKTAEISEESGGCEPGKLKVKLLPLSREYPHDSDEGTPPSHICAITLPLPIPDFQDEAAVEPGVLFFSQSDIQVLELAARRRFSVLIGNPGIGKSVTQWRLILLLLRPELWEMLRAKLVPEPLCSSFPVQAQFPFGDVTRVVRVVGAALLHTFSLGDSEVVAQSRQYSEIQLQDVNQPDTLLLWEPLGDVSSIPYFHRKLRLIATVSPDQRRYKEVTKNVGATIFVPCPTVQELFAMGKFVHERTGNALYSDENIEKRLAKFGPFTRYVIPVEEGIVKLAERAQSAALSRLSVDALFEYSTIESAEDSADVSHVLLRQVVNRDKASAFSMPQYKPASNEFQLHLALKAQIVDVERLGSKLASLDVDGKLEKWNDKYKGFQHYVVGLLHSEPVELESFPVSDMGGKQNIKFEQMAAEDMYKLPKFTAMKPNVMYYSTNLNQAVADVVWRSSKKEDYNIGQVSVAETHQHDPETFVELLLDVGVVELTGIDWETIRKPRGAEKRKTKDKEPLLGEAKELSPRQVLSQAIRDDRVTFKHPVTYYYFTWPRNKHVLEKALPLSTFFSSVNKKAKAVELVRSNVKFWACIVPLLRRKHP